MDVDCSSSRTVLRPLACLLPSADKTTVLVILNRPLEKELLKHLWQCSLFKAVTDGGTNRLYSCLEGEKDRYIPDIITGDFDSAKPELLRFYKEKSVPIISTPDQDDTDFTKCLRITIEKTKSMKVDQYVVIGFSGGRLDHQFANVATLFKATSITSTPVYLLSEGCLACLLTPGETVLQADTGLEDDWCGLIPVGRPCDHVTTSGLKWNLDDQAMAFSGLISTSNTYSDKTVTVRTDQPLLWTMGYRFPHTAQQQSL